jgi:Skp family chaperone for outer membrane proteins
MRTVVAALALSALLVTGPVFAQAPGAQAPARPAAPAQATPPPAAAAQPPRPFPQGAKFAYLNIQRVANESAEGKASTARVKALNDKKVTELSDKNKQLQAAQQKLQQGQSVLSEQARGQLEKEIERLQVEIQRFTQDAQAEVQELQQELQADFQKKLMPVINGVSAEMGLQMVFSQIDSGIIWADTGLDITGEVIKRFDGAASTAAKPQGQ